MKIQCLIAAAILTFSSGCGTNLAHTNDASCNDKRVLYVEVRSPKEIHYDKGAGLEFTTDTTAEGTPFSYTKQKEEGEFKVYQQSYHLLARERRRAIIINTHGERSRAEQVFLLSSHKSQSR